MSDFTIHTLLTTPLIEVRDVVCAGTCRHKGAVERAGRSQLVFPYRGTYVRHVGDEEAVADASQVLFFHAGEDYQVSHPNAGGDASLALTVDEALLREIAPPALLRHALHEGIAEPLEGESLALTLVHRALAPRTTHAAASSHGRQRLVDRAKLVLARDLARRWTLAEVATEVGVSAVYLTQSFREVEGVPLYRYQLRLRLARALDLLGEYDDLTALGLHLGFSSHSHFSAAFQQAYGRTPSEFRQAALHR
jgi:AraC-like DNA-binding protein